MKHISMAANKSKQRWLAAMLLLIRKNPGIRPSELNRLLNRSHSATLRNELIKSGLIRKERKGAAVHYFLKHGKEQ
jgi:hypothetical protein